MLNNLTPNFKIILCCLGVVFSVFLIAFVPGGFAKTAAIALTFVCACILSSIGDSDDY